MTEQNMLTKALKLYNIGKENYDKDNILAKKCFTLSIDTLSQLKNISEYSAYLQLIETTEADCNKMLTNNIFELIDQNNINAIKNTNTINFREINSKGNTILHHAIDIGDTSIIKELLKKGGNIDAINGNGNTLLEYACLKKDPNIINFLVIHGASMEKHLFFRKGKNKNYLSRQDIDMGILLKLIINNYTNSTSKFEDCSDFIFLDKYININEFIGLDKYTIKEFIIGLHTMFLNKAAKDVYIKIIIEELDKYDEMKSSHACSYNKIDIILTNLVPFINYPFNLSSSFIIKNEIKYLILNIIKNNKKEFKNLLLSKLFEIYINTHLFPEDYIGIIVYNFLSKIKIKM